MSTYQVKEVSSPSSVHYQKSAERWNQVIPTNLSASLAYA